MTTPPPHPPAPRSCRSARGRGGAGALAVLAPLLAGCALVPAFAPEPEPEPPPAPRGVTILAIGGASRIEGAGAVTAGAGERGGLARVRALRAELAAAGRPVVVLAAGDLLFPSLLSRRFGGAQAIDVANALDGDPEAFDELMFATFGDHDLAGVGAAGARLLDRRVEESQFRWLSGNVWFDDDGREPLVGAPNLSATATIRTGGVKIGFFGLSADAVRPDWVIGFHDLEETARDAVAGLRAAGAELVVALTHLDPDRDRALLEALGDGGPDLLIGAGDRAHVLRRGAGGRWALEAETDAAGALAVDVVPRPEGGLEVTPRAVELGPGGPAPDPAVAARVAYWLERFDRERCAEDDLPAGCTEQALGRTLVPLLGGASAIRRAESNLGNWVADLLREHFAPAVAAVDPGAPLVAFVDAGSLRLDHDLPAGYLLRRHLDELFAEPAEPVLLRLDGATLKRVAARAAASRGGAGWLQVSGLAFVHDPEAGTASDLTLLTAGGPRPLGDRDRVYAATLDRLVGADGGTGGPRGGRGGAPLLTARHVVSRSGADLESLAVAELARRWQDGIAPAVEGRICDARGAGPCLALRAGGR